MAHIHSVIDSDNRFVINPITREITNESEKIKLSQYDHNSERFTFEIPRLVDGHDMSLSSKVEIHYINIGENEQSEDVYPVSDLALDEWDTEKVVFSWLISGNATKYEGTLNFLIRFTCLTGEDVDYRWNTAIYRGISVGEGMNNSEGVVADFSDVLAAWKAEVLADNDLLLEKADTAAQSAVEAANRAETAAELAVSAAPTATVTQTSSGATVTVTDKNGTTTAILKNGEKGEQGMQGEKGADGATGADGYTPQKGTDYWTEADKAEMTAQVQAVCVAKNQGASNVGKILVVGTDGNLTLTNMPEGGASGDVVGVLDESNNILLSGNLADGTYTLKYENTDGTYTEIGTLKVGAIQPEDIINLADPTSADWQEGYRLSLSSGTTSELAGHTVTNFIPCKMGDIVRVKGFAISSSDTGSGDSSSPKILLVDANKAKIVGLYGTMASGVAQAYGGKVTVDGDISTYTIANANDDENKASSNCAFIRFDGFLLDGYTKNDVVITINQEIE